MAASDKSVTVCVGILMNHGVDLQFYNVTLHTDLTGGPAAIDCRWIKLMVPYHALISTVLEATENVAQCIAI